MDKKILVTYATYYGATANVARAIAETVASRGYSVEVSTVKEVQNLNQYEAVIVGSAIRGGKIHDDTFHFIKDHKADLGRIPVAYFVCCMTMGEEDPETRYQAETYLAEVFNKISTVKPISLGFFGSIYEYKHMEWLARLVDKAINSQEGEYHTWETVIHWNENVAETN